LSVNGIISILYSSMDRIPEITYYWGPPLERPFASILNSRQSKTPTGSEQWVINTQKATEFIREKSYTCLTSIGMNTWELLVAACSRNNTPQIIVLPDYFEEDAHRTAEKISQQFHLDSNITAFMFFQTDSVLTKPKNTWKQRDRLIIDNTDKFIPISVRPKGNMDNHLNKIVDSSKIIRDYQTEYNPKKHSRFDTKQLKNLNPKFISGKWHYLSHWTVTFNGSWPGEDQFDFYCAIMDSREYYPRSALKSLERILKQKKIFGTVKYSRRGRSFVSFTALPPARATELMRWHPRKQRHTFEPYGIAIDTCEAHKIGIKKAIYGDQNTYRNLPEKDKPLFQAVGNKADWSKEKEFRIIGDLDLNRIDPKKWFAITLNTEEASSISTKFGIKAYNLSSH